MCLVHKADNEQKRMGSAQCLLQAKETRRGDGSFARTLQDSSSICGVLGDLG